MPAKRLKLRKDTRGNSGSLVGNFANEDEHVVKEPQPPKVRETLSLRKKPVCYIDEREIQLKEDLVEETRNLDEKKSEFEESGITSSYSVMAEKALELRLDLNDEDIIDDFDEDSELESYLHEEKKENDSYLTELNLEEDTFIFSELDQFEV